MKRLTIAITAILLLSGCATAPAPTSINQTAQSKIHTVVVESFFGDSIRYQYVGTMVFGNKVQTLPVDWNLNGYFRDKLTQNLSAQYEIKPTLSPYKSPGEGTAIDQGIQYLREHYTPDYADAYVMVTYAWANDQISHSNQLMYGMGLYGKGMVFSAVADAYVIYYITIVDGHTFKSLAEIAGGVPDDAAYNIFGAALGGYHIPYRQLDNSMAVDDVKMLSADQKEILHKTLMSLIDETLPLTLQREKLIPAPPAAKKS